jgi:nicotinic acid mononucleotide adenylyltransferase
MLELLVAEQPRFAVILTSRGLYVDQALAVQRAFAPRDLAFVVGFDKIVQIFDPRYYDDREEALCRLFELARFQVAPRDGTGTAELAALLARPENQPYAARVAWLPLDALAEREQRLSSTLVRQLLAEGQDVSWAVPEAVARYIKQTDCYGVRRQEQQ